VTVLCAIDSPASAITVARAAAGIADALGAPLVLAHVLPPPARGARYARRGGALALLREHDASLGWALLDEVATRVGSPVAEACLRSGAPADVVCRLVREQAADLVVVGARVRGPSRPIRRAGVAAAVLRRTGAPVLTVPCAPAGRAIAALTGGGPVVCGVASAGERDVAVASRAGRLAAVLGVGLDLVHVISPLERRRASAPAESCSRRVVGLPPCGARRTCSKASATPSSPVRRWAAETPDCTCGAARPARPSPPMRAAGRH
jgi:nucleotide-binding universal stress UspA family protein